MAYENGLELRNEVLFRGGETVGASDWDGKIIDYINRSYRAIANGTSEFLPENVEDWWWMRGKGILKLEPVDEVGTISVTNDSASATLSQTRADSLVGWRLRVGTDSDIYTIISHTGGTDALTLDQAYLGDTAAAATLKMYKVEYTLSAAVASVMSPITSYYSPRPIHGMTPERLDQLYPLYEFGAGYPESFALLDEQTIMFSHGGLVDDAIRLEYRYKPVVSDLAATVGSIPLIPLQYRHVLADMGTVHLLVDKNDDRATTYAQSARSTLITMVRDNKRRMIKMDDRAGEILPRQSQLQRRKRLHAGYDFTG